MTVIRNIKKEEETFAFALANLPKRLYVEKVTVKSLMIEHSGVQ